MVTCKLFWQTDSSKNPARVFATARGAYLFEAQQNLTDAKNTFDAHYKSLITDMDNGEDTSCACETLRKTLDIMLEKVCTAVAMAESSKDNHDTIEKE